jgi:glyoxylase-like metal-dependent hydrolase (beta-lactamase superfamily II)
VIIIETQAVGPMFKNGFVVACGRTKQGVLIDPGDEVESLLRYAYDHQIALTHILLTHAHFDHVTGVAAARRTLGAPIYLHKDDAFLYDRTVEMGRMFGLDLEQPPPVDHFYAAGDRFEVGDLEVTPHHTPGHCPGGVCLAVVDRAAARSDGPDLFVGDTLFAGSIGRTDLPGGDYATLMHSITHVLLPFGDAARVHPGHGPSTTIGQERKTNPFLNR